MNDAVAVDAKRILLRYGAPISVLDKVSESERIAFARTITRTSLAEREDVLRGLLVELGYMEPVEPKGRRRGSRSRNKAGKPGPGKSAATETTARNGEAVGAGPRSPEKSTRSKDEGAAGVKPADAKPSPPADGATSGKRTAGAKKSARGKKPTATKKPVKAKSPGSKTPASGKKSASANRKGSTKKPRSSKKATPAKERASSRKASATKRKGSAKKPTVAKDTSGKRSSGTGKGSSKQKRAPVRKAGTRRRPGRKS